MVTIRNKLHVLRGNKIIVPGCEPVSAFTSPTLAANWECTSSVIDLDVALQAIPGSYVEWMNNPKTLFFILPDGPPPAPDICDTPCSQSVNDWYQVLRDNADGTLDDLDEDTRTELERSCSSIYDYGGGRGGSIL